MDVPCAISSVNLIPSYGSIPTPSKVLRESDSSESTSYEPSIEKIASYFKPEFSIYTVKTELQPRAL